jgi:hypothetical protein
MQIDVARDRTFSVDGLLPAKYRIYVTGSGSQAGEIPDVDLTGGDVDGFVAEPTPVFDLRVSARMEDAAAMVPAQLEAFDLERGSGRTGRLETGGVYPFRLSPGIYRLEARRADRVFVKGVSINGQPMPDVLLDLRKGTPGTVEAILSPHVASLEGRLDRPDGELPTLAIAVVLMDETASRTQVEGEQVTVDHSGKFKLESLAPGKYRLFAIEGFEESLWGSLELAAALREKSLALELHEGETRAVAVPVITFDAWTAALRKVGM